MSWQSDELSNVASEIRARGRKSAAIIADIGAIEAHGKMLDEAEAALGPLTTLVNNAGVSVLSRGDLLDVTPESYDRCLAINTRGTFFLTQAFARRLAGRRPAGPSQHRHRDLDQCARALDRARANTASRRLARR